MSRTRLAIGILVSLAALSPLIVALPVPPPPPLPPPPGSPERRPPQWTEVLALQELVRDLETEVIDFYMTDPRGFEELRRFIEQAIVELPPPRTACLINPETECTPPAVCCEGICRTGCGPRPRRTTQPVPLPPPR